MKHQFRVSRFEKTQKQNPRARKTGITFVRHVTRDAARSRLAGAAYLLMCPMAPAVTVEYERDCSISENGTPKQKARSLEHALFLLFQTEWVFGPIWPELYFSQDQWFMQEAMGNGLDKIGRGRAKT